jgi:hypothetical protein
MAQKPKGNTYQALTRSCQALRRKVEAMDEELGERGKELEQIRQYLLTAPAGAPAGAFNKHAREYLRQIIAAYQKRNQK